MDTIKRLPWAAQNSVFQKLAEKADVSSLTKEERLHYDEALRKYRDPSACWNLVCRDAPVARLYGF